MMSREMPLTISNLGSGVVMLSTVSMISVKATRLITHANTSEIAHDRKTKMTLRRTLRVDFMSRVGMDTPLLFSKVTKNCAKTVIGHQPLVISFPDKLITDN